jgi:L-ascorbate metabolism protein UlaG (beta-lactamase superfamily)
VLNQIQWLGHSSVRLDSEKIIYIDPWKIKGGPKADLVLISHSHGDHLSPADVRKIQQENTVIIAAGDATAQLTGDVRALKPGDQATVPGVTVRAVPAYNIGKAYHPKANGWIGFLITIGNKTVYYAGDTDLIPEMEDIRADILILPVGGTYTMTAMEAAEAANLIGPEAAIPIHYGDIVGTAADAEQFKKLCKAPVEIKTIVSG